MPPLNIVQPKQLPLPEVDGLTLRRELNGLRWAGAALIMLVSLLLVVTLLLEIPPLLIMAWLIFGLASVALGYGLSRMQQAHPLLYQQLTETCNRLVREVPDQEVALTYIVRLLLRKLDIVGLSIWRYNAQDNLLELLRVEGEMPIGIYQELPVDLDAKQLHGTWLMNTLPESAFHQGLRTVGVQVITSLSLGDELIGFIGLGQPRTKKHYDAQTLRWLNVLAGQLALVVKNVGLINNLEDTVQKLQLAYRRTIDVEEEERRHLAVELHDDILSRLTTMGLTLHSAQRLLAADSSQMQGWLANLAQETDYLNRRLREITQGLHPAVLTDLGLILALQAYMDSLSRQCLSHPAPRTVTLTAQGFGNQRIIEPNMERDLYYVIRQALDNALKHAQAKAIFIHLRWSEVTITATIQDTGIGLKDSPEQLMGQNGRLGFLSINERVLAWQGRLTIHTEPGLGTTIHASFPTAQPSDAPTQLQAFTHYV